MIASGGRRALTCRKRKATLGIMIKRDTHLVMTHTIRPAGRVDGRHMA